MSADLVTQSLKPVPVFKPRLGLAWKHSHVAARIEIRSVGIGACGVGISINGSQQIRAVMSVDALARLAADSDWLRLDCITIYEPVDS
jgi:hypothetical protein